MNDTPPAHGPALLTARFKFQAVDFRVNEVLDIAMDGSGEHLYLHIEKVSTNTDEVASLLENSCAVASADVGLSGLKDRHAVTRQWFSVRTPKSADEIEQVFEAFNHKERTAESASEQDASHNLAPGNPGNMGKSLRLIESVRHSRKLRRGAHRANEFTIVLRDVLAIEPTDESTVTEHQSLVEAVNDRVKALSLSGFPNYIGPQRFGHGGQNLVRAKQWFRQPKKRTSRQQRSLWLSAARSALFNEVCAARVRADTWCCLLPGEPAVLDGTRSFFDSTVADGEELATRLATFDIHPSAPWWGRGRSVAKDDCDVFEQGVLAAYADLCTGLEKAGLPQERRALRARAEGLSLRWLDEQSLELHFRLPPGVFATTLLREIGHCSEPAR